jgi:hypothetical protein
MERQSTTVIICFSIRENQSPVLLFAAIAMTTCPPTAKRMKTAPSAVVHKESIGCHAHLLNKIIMLARPTYPYIDEIKDYCGSFASFFKPKSYQSYKLWGGRGTYDDKSDNGNFRHAYFAHDPDTPRRHRAWNMNEAVIDHLKAYFRYAFASYHKLKDIVCAVKHGKRKSCINDNHSKYGYDCLTYPERCRWHGNFPDDYLWVEDGRTIDWDM